MRILHHDNRGRTGRVWTTSCVLATALFVLPSARAHAEVAPVQNLTLEAQDPDDPGLAELRRELATLRRENAALQKKLSKLEKKIASAQAELDEMRSEALSERARDALEGGRYRLAELDASRALLIEPGDEEAAEILAEAREERVRAPRPFRGREHESAAVALWAERFFPGAGARGRGPGCDPPIPARL